MLKPTRANRPTMAKMQYAAETKREQYGLAQWMRRVLEECDKLGDDFAPDPVHDLRVAIRRCRSLADGLMAFDPLPDWKRMKKAAKPLFRCLGELRDTQVMADWIQKLGSPDDAVSKALFDFASTEEESLKEKAVSALQEFDRKQWKAWSEVLPKRAERVPLQGLAFRHLALERWNQAHQLHRQALRNRTKTAFHRLRIGLKRFRYTVENFLPVMHEKWEGDLKELQDLLGEAHDLDVFWATALRIKAFPDTAARERWQGRIAKERDSRLRRYREKMVGQNSLWPAWRVKLPQGEEITAAATERLKLWASFLDPDFNHAQHVAALALQLYDSLDGDRPPGRMRQDRTRLILQAAALMHDVGRAKQNKQHQKASYRLIRKLSPPLGWEAHDLQMAGLVARYHRGGLPSAKQKGFARFSAAQKRTIEFLSGILRLADALDRQRDGAVRRLEVEKTGDFLTAWVQGDVGNGRSWERVAAARHLLEVVYNRPLLVRKRA